MPGAGWTKDESGMWIPPTKKVGRPKLNARKPGRPKKADVQARKSNGLKKLYEVKRGPHGIAVFGDVPATDMVQLTTKWAKDYGYNLLDSAVSGALKAAFAATDTKGSKAWRSELGC